jgi:hypothetical protein
VRPQNGFTINVYYPASAALMARQGRSNQATVVKERPAPAEQRVPMTFAQRRKRVFDIDIKTCSECTGAVKVIACIEDPKVLKQILKSPQIPSPNP